MKNYGFSYRRRKEEELAEKLNAHLNEQLNPEMSDEEKFSFAEFDPEKMMLIRRTEQVAVPERGARLGNFGCLHVNDNESWVVASEWMQTTAPDHYNYRRCMSYGSDNSIFIARITWQE